MGKEFVRKDSRLNEDVAYNSGFSLVEVMVAVGIFSVAILVSLTLLKSLTDGGQRLKIASDYELIEKTAELAISHDASNCAEVLRVVSGPVLFSGTDVALTNISVDGNPIVSVGQDFGSVTLTGLHLREVRPGLGRRSGVDVNGTDYNTYLAQLDLQVNPKSSVFFGGGINTKSIILKIFSRVADNVVDYCLDGSADVRMSFSTTTNVVGGDGGSTGGTDGTNIGDGNGR